MDFEDHPAVYRDTSAVSVLEERLRAEDSARDAILDQQIRMGWGSTDGTDIPANWRDIRGPEKILTPEHRAAISAARRRQVAAAADQG
jgi:hypothetical protein